MSNTRLFTQTAKSPVFSTISFALIVFLVYAVSFISKFSVYPSDINAGEVLNAPPQVPSDTQNVADKTSQVWAPKAEKSSDTIPQVSTVQEMNEAEELDEEEDGETPDPLIPPAKASKEQRMEWFRRKLPELEILNSTNRSRKFHGRVVKLFDNQCAIQFFMIWFSPTRMFGPRDFLAVDTLMKTNPEACLVLLSRSLDTRRGYKILKPLLDRGFKILAVTPDLPSLVKNTPAEAWLKKIKSGKIDPGKNPLSVQFSNLIRLAVLYKYGGVYLDTDFIILKDFKGLRNAVGVQSENQVTHKWKTVNSAAMIFDKEQPILFEFLQEFAATFDGNIWGHNGPYLLTRVIKRMDDPSCYNLSVLPIKAFYPVNWVEIERFYRTPATPEESKWVEETVQELNRETYGLHLWNKVTRGFVINERSVIDRLIKSHCLICRKTYNS
ncbi:alpha 1,4-glycosyltransferase family protein [Melia azedarach]|uniref:Alpha 1,4-glycosyltransferase family protein n=1 Tax=Melia azedarach TaxID=155640 RepID=A0ACC1X2R0_MELAZ|nr:alpha 1,4-glycosyltransferase family protein [Melia azedarach]